MENNDRQIRLSPSKLNLFQDCPLCFWLQEVKGIHRPEGPKSTLPSGMDLLIKKYFDKYRAMGKMPPEIEGKVQGKLLADQDLLKKWRFWGTGLKFEDKKLNAVLYGALDECFVESDSSSDSGQVFYIPVDYKTRGFALKEDSFSYYQTQLDCYTLLLESAGYKHLSFGYLIYYIPEIVEENGIVKFRIDLQKIETDPQRGYKIFSQAVECLRGPQPLSHSECKFCSWGNDFVNFE
jgi:hypothetical protein